MSSSAIYDTALGARIIRILEGNDGPVSREQLRNALSDADTHVVARALDALQRSDAIVSTRIAQDGYRVRAYRLADDHPRQESGDAEDVQAIHARIASTNVVLNDQDLHGLRQGRLEAFLPETPDSDVRVRLDVPLPLHVDRELQLMAALDRVVHMMKASAILAVDPLDAAGVARAVAWLHSKHATSPAPGEAPDRDSQ